MKLPFRKAAAVLAVCIVCQPVPLTGRRQLSLIPEEQLLNASYQQYNQLLEEKEVVLGTPSAEKVRNTGINIRNAVVRYLGEHGLEERIEGYEWEFTLFRDSTANAFCMPGGKVGIFTGIIDITRDETGLAVVIGHEVAHAIADHSNERMSQMLLTQLGGAVLTQALSDNPGLTSQLLLSAFGLGAQVGILLPYSRLHESEADQLGLIFMAMAGYDPRAAVGFWQRMESKAQVQPPEFLSTHPSHETRIENIRKLLPGIRRKYYRK